MTNVFTGMISTVAGLVRSPLETAAMRGALGPDTLLVVPGIRSAPLTGRWITRAGDPRAEAMKILGEIG